MDVPSAAGTIAQVFATLLVALIFSERRQMRAHPSRRKLASLIRELGMAGLLSGTMLLILLVLANSSGDAAVFFLWIVVLLNGLLGLGGILMAMVDWKDNQERTDKCALEDHRAQLGRPRLSRTSFVQARARTSDRTKTDRRGGRKRKRS